MKLLAQRIPYDPSAISNFCERMTEQLKIFGWQIGADMIYDPFFFDESVNRERYLAMLRDGFWPALQRNGKQDLPFMQDKAPPHLGLQVSRWANKFMDSISKFKSL